LENYNETQLKTWEQSIGFHSLQTKIYNVFHQIAQQDTLNPDETANANAINNVLSANKTTIRMETDATGEQRIVPIVDDTHYGNLLNEKAVAIIGDYAVKIIDNYKITAPKADVELLANTTSVANATQWNVMQYAGISTKSFYGTTQQASASNGGHNWPHCNGGNRVFIECIAISNNQTGGYYTCQFRYRVTSEAKSFGCIWYHYWASMDARNVSGYIAFGSHTYGFGFAPYSQYKVWALQETSAATPSVYLGSSATAYFTKVYGEATNPTVMPNWAVINCQ
jgi:hypothetical protein